ncbi:MAG: cellulase [Ferruginibacter sp.]|uniref:glycoside hydrolase family 9 protein n=1 Tax=Ferruginibacter sp. TaxID=1940288 RepID=UPI002659963F|nr:glycoside hydrolase family 9 protein [Ferruginibacter sp.]MDB5279042.1 cellulase [Ferruginibacter sp.]
MNRKLIAASFLSICLLCSMFDAPGQDAWIRINQLGYTPDGIKVAVWCGKGAQQITSFNLVDSASGKAVFTTAASKNFGVYGPFENTYRLNFSMFQQPGRYFLSAGNATSPVFSIGADVYKGVADFCLQYMRQQRSGFNPYLKDSCHTHDGYTLYAASAGIKDSTHIDVSGGWHDASDYLQYSTTSANATYHLLMAYRDFPSVFTDYKMANGLDGKDGVPDVLNEAKWGLDWLLKMHPKPGLLFNQLGDDRDHMGMRIPKEDSFYGRGFERPVYFVSGEPQQRGKFMNNTTGTSSTAAKFASAFGLGSILFGKTDTQFATILQQKAITALAFAGRKPGVTQTASVRSPYIYAEDNWVDDMELANAVTAKMIQTQGRNKPNALLPATISKAMRYAAAEPVTPWLGADTAKHYQWYPFINIGHYELAKQLKGKTKDSITGYYKAGIERVWDKAKQNAFYRGIPFIWCSNNLTTSFAIQCYWYRQLTGDTAFAELEQANTDWLFGCNPWGTSMVYGLPAWGDSPVDPHSAFTHLKQYPINGGLVDGPVYTTIFSNLIGIRLQEADEYAAFQSGLAVYHDDYGDYSTNEPTMDGTASLIYLAAAKEAEASRPHNTVFKGAVTRGRTDKKQLALVFTGDEFADGGEHIAGVLHQQNIQAGFFFTGKFYRNPAFRSLVKKLRQQGHYLGPHSDQHLLYCDWNNRDSLLVTKQQFTADLKANLQAISKNGIAKPTCFLPPYEWYNDSIAAWTKACGLQLINYSPGTLSNADYTYPGLKNYRSSGEIYRSILQTEASDAHGLNGYILLLHIGTDSRRTDKLYDRLNELITALKQKGYAFKRVDELLR